jgi:hypothetical protein
LLCFIRPVFDFGHGENRPGSAKTGRIRASSVRDAERAAATEKKHPGDIMEVGPR